jgi:O-antigen/teichoic acid export membrane protein
MRDAFVTIATRFGLAVLIFATDIVLARALGPAAKGRFALVLLYSQLAAVVVGWGMDQALAVVAGRDHESARRGFANAVLWTLVVGGFGVVLSGWLYGLPTDTRPAGPLADVIPNLSAAQFVYSALALPGELFFAIGLFALLGRRRVVAYSVIRVMRRALLLVLIIGLALIAQLSLDAVLLLNLVTLVATAAAIVWVAAKDGTFSLRPSGPLLLEELRFGSRAIVGATAERLQFRADAFLVNAIVGVRATGVYSVTSGLAETLWYVPNALGVVMFSRAVDPKADAGRIAALLTRTTIAVTLVTAIPAFVLGPRLVRFVYGSQFADAGVALRLILPGVVAYSVVAILSRYIVGQGRPGIGTLVLLTGLVANIVCNLVLIPKYGIVGAAAASSISYLVTALVTLAVFRRLSGQNWTDILIVRRSDIEAVARTLLALRERLRGRHQGPLLPVHGGPETADLVIGEREPGEER